MAPMDLELKWYDIDRLDNRRPDAIAWVANTLGPLLRRYFRSEVRGVERVPSGGALYVGNHNSGTLTPDTYLLCEALYRAHGLSAVPYGLGHEFAISLPIIRQIVVPLGAVRASHENGERLLRDGKKVLVYPGGDEDAFRPYRQRHQIAFGGRRGYIRLALRTGVPIVPVVAAGAHGTFWVIDDLKWLAKLTGAGRWGRFKVWPLTLSIPWGLTLGPILPHIPWPAKILIEVLPPIRFDRYGAEAAEDEPWVRQCAERVETAIQDTLSRLARELDGK